MINAKSASTDTTSRAGARVCAWCGGDLATDVHGLGPDGVHACVHASVYDWCVGTASNKPKSARFAKYLLTVWIAAVLAFIGLNVAVYLRDAAGAARVEARK